MVLHSTLSEIHFKKSVMSYLIAKLATERSVPLFFNVTMTVPRNSSGVLLDSWVVVSFDDRKLSTLASAFIMFDIYTRKDNEGFESSRILDKITDMFTKEDSTIGLVSIPYYDTTEVAIQGEIGEEPTIAPWVLIGGMIPLHRRTTGCWPGKDDTQIRSVSYELRWGAR